MSTFPFLEGLRFESQNDVLDKVDTATRFSPRTSAFLCQDHYTGAPTLYFINISRHCEMLATDSVMKQNMCSQPYFVSHSHAHARKHTHTHTQHTYIHRSVNDISRIPGSWQCAISQTIRIFNCILILLHFYILI